MTSRSRVTDSAEQLLARSLVNGTVQGSAAREDGQYTLLIETTEGHVYRVIGTAVRSEGYEH